MGGEEERAACVGTLLYSDHEYRAGEQTNPMGSSAQPPPAKALQSSALPRAHTQRDTASPWVLLITVLAQGQQPAQSNPLHNAKFTIIPLQITCCKISPDPTGRFEIICKH